MEKEKMKKKLNEKEKNWNRKKIEQNVELEI